MRAGQLRHLIVFEKVTETQNEYGEPAESWAPFAEAWASREDLTGREYFASKQNNAEVTTRFRLRYVAGLNAKMRIRSGETLYQIDAVQDPEGRGRTLEILASRAG